jgi:hypothetical protein
MKTGTKTAFALAVAGLVNACASGGGSGDGSQTPARPGPVLKSNEPVPVCYAFFFCKYASEEDEQKAALIKAGLLPRYTGTFTTWSQLPPLTTPYYNTDVEWNYDAVDVWTGYQRSQGTVSSTTTWTAFESTTHGPEYDASGKLHTIFSFGRFDPLISFTTLAAIGQPGIDVAYARFAQASPTNLPGLFLDNGANGMALAANPYTLGWSYQSFGVWDRSDRNSVNATSFGAATPVGAVPTTGSATFTGKLGGFYLSPTGQGSTATAELTVNANFSSRSLSFASGGTTLTRDLNSVMPAPNLNLKGTLTYSPGSSSFSGTLTNAGATMSGSSSGRFYGPAAQELGGVLTVKSATSVETFVGAYGAKR